MTTHPKNPLIPAPMRLIVSLSAAIAVFTLFWFGLKSFESPRLVTTQPTSDLGAVLGFFEPVPVVQQETQIVDPGSGRFVSYEYQGTVAIRLAKVGTIYEVTGGRFDSVGGQRIVGTFNPLTNTIQGKFLFTRQGGSTSEDGFSTFKGAWDPQDDCLLVVEDQGDAQMTYRFRREVVQ